MSKSRNINLPQHDYDQGHYGELPIESLPSALTASGSTFIWDGSAWYTGTVTGGSSNLQELITGNNAYFATGTGNWTNSGGTLSHDTGVKWNNYDGSLKLSTTASGTYVELDIAGTFLADVDYHAIVVLSCEESPSTLSYTIDFGLIGTDAKNFSTTQTGSQSPGGGLFRIYALKWQPTANRTGVKLRFSRAGVETGTQNWHIGHARAILPYGGGFSIFPSSGQSYLPSALYGGKPEGLFLDLDSFSGLYSFDSSKGIGIFNSGGVSIYADHTPANRANEGFNLEVGDDLVGFSVSEKDSNTIQIYPDFGDYDIELLDGDGGGGGSTGKWYVVNNLGTRYALSDLAASGSGGGHLGFLVAANDSTTEDKNAADFVCDGTADNSELQSAIDALESGGGGELRLAAGTYTLAAGLLVDTNVRIRIIGHGATLLLPASVSGIKIKQGNVGAVGAGIEGVIIDGQSNSSTVGIEFEDTNNGWLYDCQIENCTTGILLDSQASNAFVEGTAITGIVIRTCTTGIATSVTSGTGSFAQTVMHDIKITGTTNGISLPNNSIFQRSVIQSTCWVANGQTAYNFDCNIEDSTFDLAIEGASGSTTNTGIIIGSNATNTDQAFFKLLFTGTVNTQANFNSKNVHYWSGGSQIVQSAGTAVLGYKRHGDSTDRLRFEGLTAGGRIQFGTGSALDTNIYRSAANILSSDDKFDPASLNIQTKAGTPGDGDVTGGASDGDIIMDTTNGILYVRSGGSWNPISSKTASINFVIDGGGSTITTGIKGDIVLDFACTIQSVTMLADQTGSIVVDIWKDTYANYPPDNADSITAGATPTISSAIKSQDATLTGWTTSITAGDILRFNVDSATSITRCTLDLKIVRT